MSHHVYIGVYVPNFPPIQGSRGTGKAAGTGFLQAA